MVAKITVNPELLRWAVDRSGLSFSDFREPVQEWIRGDSHPTVRKLEGFARKAMIPLGYLFLASPPAESIGIPDFRTIRDEKRRTYSPNLRDTITDLQRRQAWMREYLIEAGNDPLAFVGSITQAQSPSQAAVVIRKELRLTAGWQGQQSDWEAALTMLRRAIEHAGIFISMTNQVGLNTRRALNQEEFRGFVLIDDYAPWIFVNTNDAKSAQMFTLAHEMVHVWVGKAGLFNLDKLEVHHDGIEQFCNRVAAEFLLPEDLFQKAWTLAGSVSERCKAVANAFKVSPLVAGRRAFELGLISSRSFFQFYRDQMERWREMKEKNRGKSAPVFWQQQRLRLSDRFGYAVAQAYAERKLLPSEAQDLTGFSRDTFSKYASRMLRRMREAGQ